MEHVVGDLKLGQVMPGQHISLDRNKTRGHSLDDVTGGREEAHHETSKTN